MSSRCNHHEHSDPNCDACQLKLAQKRLALQQEKLAVDKQLVLEEKKALRRRFPKEREKKDKVWKQVSQKQQHELEQSKARIQELELLLHEKERASPRHDLQNLQHHVEELQAQLQKEHDDHEGIVGELNSKIDDQEKELEQFHRGDSVASLGSSASKKENDSYAIQQYKNKLQSLRLAMEVAVRRTEMDWKERVDELEVQLATQEGEFEEFQAQYEEQLRHTEHVETQLMDLQIQFEAREEAHAVEREQLEESIERMQNEQKGSSAFVANGQQVASGDMRVEEVEEQLADLGAQMVAREKSHARERKQLEETIKSLQNKQQVAAVATTSVATASVAANYKGERFSDVDEENNDLQKTSDELKMMHRKQEEYLQKQEQIFQGLRALLTIANQTSPEEFAKQIPLIRERSKTLEEELNTLEQRRRADISIIVSDMDLAGANQLNTLERRRLADRSVIDTTSASSSFRRRTDKKEVKKSRHVSDTDWVGANQIGKYTGYVDENGEPHGRGKLEVENGDVYEGEWKNGKRHGQGVYTWAQGDLYTGPWRKNKRHGHGVFVWSDGRLYDGEYNMGKREGKGIFTWPYGAKYEGDYKDNKRNGHGVYVKADGQTYTGEYENDRPHGRGVETDSKGKVISEGTFSFGVFIPQDSGDPSGSVVSI
jgi:hypothetical protein